MAYNRFWLHCSRKQPKKWNQLKKIILPLRGVWWDGEFWAISISNAYSVMCHWTPSMTFWAISPYPRSPWPAGVSAAHEIPKHWISPSLCIRLSGIKIRNNIFCPGLFSWVRLKVTATFILKILHIQRLYYSHFFKCLQKMAFLTIEFFILKVAVEFLSFESICYFGLDRFFYKKNYKQIQHITVNPLI